MTTEFAEFEHLKAFSIVLWDLDSSLCDTRQRWWMIPEIKAHKKTWDDYSMACVHDLPIPGTVALLRQMTYVNRHIALSARADCALDNTWRWLSTNDVPLDGVILRPTGSRVNPGIWKVGKIRRLKRAGFDIVLVVEDNQVNAERIMEKTGVPVLGVNPFYNEDSVLPGGSI